MKAYTFPSLRGVRILGAAMLFSLAAVAASAQGAGLPPAEDGAMARLGGSPRHGEWVSIEAGGKGASDKLAAWVVYPERPDAAPVVLVIHEIFGLNDWARAVADQLAAEGYIAVAPDLLSGKAPGGAGSSAVTPDGARALIAQLDGAEVARRLDAAADYAMALPAAAKRFGVVGFCWGGGISFTYASTRADLGAAVSFYGVAPPPAALARIKAPVLALYGGNDARVTSTEAPAAAELKRLGKRFESEIYAGAGHAFLRQQGGMNGANLEATRLSWPRVLQFLKGTLSTAQTGAADSPAGLAATPAAYDDCCEMDEVAALPASPI
jgi:carboxymethylenebutenolidase